MLDVKDFTNKDIWLIAVAAVERGIAVNFLYPSDDGRRRGILELTFGERSEYVIGELSSATDAFAFRVQKNKHYTKLFLKRSGISVPEGFLVKKGEVDNALLKVTSLGFPVVIKPVNGMQGVDVNVGVRTESEVASIVKNIEKDVVIESQFQNGREYRLFATREKLIAAVERVPANVIGDGKHTVSELINLKNLEPQRFKEPLIGIKKLKLDTEAIKCLSSNGHTGESVPPEGLRVYLRKTSNISQGGDAIDVTDIIHSSVAEIAVNSVRAIPGLAYAGIDFMTNTSVEHEQTASSYVIIEVNASPMLSIHHYPYQGQKRDVTGAIIDLLFPETKK